MKKTFSLLLLLVLAASSCSTKGTLPNILGISAAPPVFLDCRPVSSTELVFSFSGPVEVVSLNFDRELEAESVENGQDVRVNFAKPLEEGIKITADILVEDSDRNSLNVIVPFRTRNSRIPPLLFNEIRTEAGKPRVEFIEFFASGPGNLGAARLYVAGRSLSEPVYEFPPAEVKAGDYIVLHLRTTEEGCKDETGGNPALSRGTDALDSALDFWLPGDKKQLHKTDAFWLLDQDDRIIDAVLLCGNPGEWGKNNSALAAELFGRNGAWPSAAGTDGIPGAGDAVDSGASAPTRTICRDESLPPERRAGNWYITAQGYDTPGRQNDPRRHQPKSKSRSAR